MVETEIEDEIIEVGTEVFEVTDVPIVEEVVAPKPVRQRFVVNLPGDITQNDFQARLNALRDPSLPVKAIWRAFLKNGAVSIRLKKAT